MAYIVQTVTAGTDGTSATTCDFADWLDQQQSGDYLVVIAANDTGTTGLTGMSGWTQHYLSASAISGTRAGVWSQKNTGTPITAPTLSGTSAAWAMVALLIRDADGTNFLDVAASTTEQTANTWTPTCPAVTTANANALVLRIITTDGIGNARPQTPYQGAFAANRVDNQLGTPAISISVDYQVQFAAGSTGTYACYTSANDGGTQTTLAIRNASGGKVPAMPTNTPLTPILSLVDSPSAPTATLLSALHASPATLLGYECALGDATGGAVRSAITGNNATYGGRGYYGYTRSIGQSQTNTTGLGSRTYGGAWSVTADLSANLFVAQVIPTLTTLQARLVNAGGAFYFRDNAGAYALWRPFTEAQALQPRPIVAHLPSETMVETGGGTINWASITYIGAAFPINATGGAANWEFNFWLLATMPYSSGTATPLSVVGGIAAKPITARDVAQAAYCPYLNGIFGIQGAKQQLIGIPVQIGDGTNATAFDGQAGATEYQSGLTIGFRAPNSSLPYKVKAKSTDSILFGSQSVGSSNAHKFIVDSASSTSATYDFGATIFGMTPTLIDGITLTGTAFASCGEIDAQTATLVNCTIKNTTSTDAAIAYDANGSMSGCTIDLTGTSAAYHIELGTAVTAFTLTNVTFTGTPGTDKVHVRATTGTVTITLSGTTLVAGDVTSDGATVSLVAPTDDLTVTSNISGTLLQVFTTGTQTVLASTTGTSLTYTHSGDTVDIVAQKAGYLPQRVTGIALSGDTTRAFTLLPDYNYDAAHGLTYTTSASWSRTNNQLTVPTWGPTVRQVYSLMIDSFISEASLRNTAFNLSMNGPTTLFLTNGAEGATDASITNMTGGGVRYLSGAGAATAEFVGVQSSGVVSGSQAEYELGDGTAVVDARATGNVNEIIKSYGDASHGNFDKRGYLQFKVQRNGYREAYYDIVENYGDVTPTLYVIPLAMVAIDGLTLGDPGITGVTVTKHGSPVSWDAGDGAKNYSITIEDGNTNSGTAILRWLNYNLSLDATFQGAEPFYWPEMVLDNGAAFESLRGIYHGNPDVVAGVRVIRTGGDPHPDFTRFQADDGTYGTPPTVATASVTSIVNGSRLRVYNATAATEVYNGVPGTSWSLTYTDGTDFTAGDTVEVTITYQSGTTAKLCFEQSAVAAAAGWSIIAAQEDDDVYIALGVNGSAVTGFAADYVNDEVNVTVASNWNMSDLYAWWVYNLTTSQGIAEFCGGITALDQANFRINNSIVDIYIDNTTATNLRQLDNRRIYRADGAYPVKSSGGGGIDVVWRNTILLAETGVSGLTPEESTLLSQAANLTVDIETGYNAARTLKIIAAAVAGKTSGQPGSPVFRNLTDNADQITATVDSSGNRTSITHGA